MITRRPHSRAATRRAHPRKIGKPRPLGGRLLVGCLQGSGSGCSLAPHRVTHVLWEVTHHGLAHSGSSGAAGRGADLSPLPHRGTTACGCGPGAAGMSATPVLTAAQEAAAVGST